MQSLDPQFRLQLETTFEAMESGMIPAYCPSNRFIADHTKLVSACRMSQGRTLQFLQVHFSETIMTAICETRKRFLGFFLWESALPWPLIGCLTFSTYEGQVCRSIPAALLLSPPYIKPVRISKPENLTCLLLEEPT